MKRYLTQWMVNGVGYGYYFEDYADAFDYAQLNGEKSKVTDTKTGKRIFAFKTINNQRWSWTKEGWIN